MTTELPGPVLINSGLEDLYRHAEASLRWAADAAEELVGVGLREQAGLAPALGDCLSILGAVRRLTIEFERRAGLWARRVLCELRADVEDAAWIIGGVHAWLSSDGLALGSVGAGVAGFAMAQAEFVAAVHETVVGGVGRAGGEASLGAVAMVVARALESVRAVLKAPLLARGVVTARMRVLCGQLDASDRSLGRVTRSLNELMAGVHGLPLEPAGVADGEQVVPMEAFLRGLRAALVSRYEVVWAHDVAAVHRAGSGAMAALLARAVRVVESIIFEVIASAPASLASGGLERLEWVRQRLESAAAAVSVSRGSRVVGGELPDGPAEDEGWDGLERFARQLAIAPAREFGRELGVAKAGVLSGALTELGVLLGVIGQWMVLVGRCGRGEEGDHADSELQGAVSRFLYPAAEQLDSEAAAVRVIRMPRWRWPWRRRRAQVASGAAAEGAVLIGQHERSRS